MTAAAAPSVRDLKVLIVGAGFGGVTAAIELRRHGFRNIVMLDAAPETVIGTGASAVQFVPEVAREARKLTVFQRTGNWFLPRKNRAYPSAIRALIRRVPAVQAFRRGFMFQYTEAVTASIRHPRRWAVWRTHARLRSCAGS